MKKVRLKSGLIGLFILTQMTMMAKETIAIINFDVIGSNYKESQYISMVTSEIRKLEVNALNFTQTNPFMIFLQFQNVRANN